MPHPTCAYCGAPATPGCHFRIRRGNDLPLCRDCLNELPHPIDLTHQARRLARREFRAIQMPGQMSIAESVGPEGEAWRLFERFEAEMRQAREQPPEAA